MTPDERAKRWKEIDDELAALYAGKVVDGDPVSREQALLDEQDALEFEAGEEYFENR